MDAAPDAGVADLVLQVRDGLEVAVAEAGQAGDGEVDVAGPEERAMTRPPAGVMQECALGYSGWFGVPGSRGVHAGSPTVRRCRRCRRPGWR